MSKGAIGKTVSSETRLRISNTMKESWIRRKANG
jgi:hypothetical protein